MAEKKDRDFKAEFDDWFEKCELEDIVYAVHELERYAWLESVRDDAIDGEEDEKYTTATTT